MSIDPTTPPERTTDLPCIVTRSGQVLAQARRADQFIYLEGYWYFHPEVVDFSSLEISDRTYLCPYKGTCYWIDLRRGSVSIPDAAWVYPTPKPGFRKIANWVGFYENHTHYAKSECRAQGES